MAMRAWKLLLLCTCRILAKKLCTHYFQCTYQVSRSIQQSFLPFCWIIHFIIQWMTRTWSYLKQNTMGKFLNRNHWWVWFIIWCWLYQSRSSLNVVTPPPLLRCFIYQRMLLHFHFAWNPKELYRNNGKHQCERWWIGYCLLPQSTNLLVSSDSKDFVSSRRDVSFLRWLRRTMYAATTDRSQCSRLFLSTLLLFISCCIRCRRIVTTVSDFSFISLSILVYMHTGLFDAHQKLNNKHPCLTAQEIRWFCASSAGTMKKWLSNICPGGVWRIGIFACTSWSGSKDHAYQQHHDSGGVLRLATSCFLSQLLYLWLVTPRPTKKMTPSQRWIIGEDRRLRSENDHKKSTALQPPALQQWRPAQGTITLHPVPCPASPGPALPSLWETLGYLYYH